MIRPDDIVQITDENHHWFPALVVVSELKSFGLQGFVFIPQNNGQRPGQAYTRLGKDQYEKVGTLVLVPSDDSSPAS